MATAKFHSLIFAVAMVAALLSWQMGDHVTQAITARRLTQTPVAITPLEMSRGPLGRHQVALTFDAGYEATDLALLLATLDRLQVRATFFLTGKWVKHYPVETQWFVQSLHAIGNHSSDHPEYTRLTDEQIRNDLLAADALLTSRLGRPIRPLFRAPFGGRDERVLRILGENGYLSVYWSLDTLDAMEPRKSAAFIANRILEQPDGKLDGAIILGHVGYPETCVALPHIVKGLRARGYEFVTVAEWLEPNSLSPRGGRSTP